MKTKTLVRSKGKKNRVKSKHKIFKLTVRLLEELAGLTHFKSIESFEIYVLVKMKHLVCIGTPTFSAIVFSTLFPYHTGP